MDLSRYINIEMTEILELIQKCVYTNRAIIFHFFVFQCHPLRLHCAIQGAEILVVEPSAFLMAEIHTMISSCYRNVGIASAIRGNLC